MADEDWAAEVDEQERQITGQISDMSSISHLAREHVRKFSVLPVTNGLLLIFVSSKRHWKLSFN